SQALILRVRRVSREQHLMSVRRVQAADASAYLGVHTMNTKTTLAAVAGLTVLACLVLSSAIVVSYTTDAQKAARLETEATITRVEAEKIALAKVPGGSLKEPAIQKENGRVVWSFDVATPGTAHISEVQVDAMSGEVATMEKENPAHKAKQKRGKDLPNLP